MEIASRQTTGVGTIYRWTLTLPFGLRFHFEEMVTEWVEPACLAYRAISGWEMEAQAVLTPEGGGTRETFTVRNRAPGIWKWLIPQWLVRLGSQRALAEQERLIHRTGTTKWNTLEVTEHTERRLQIRITRCLYHELAVSVGAPEITPLVCQIDNAIFNADLPDQMIFHRGGLNRRIADGNSQCDFIWEMVK